MIISTLIGDFILPEDFFFEVAKTEAYRNRFYNATEINEGNGREYYRENNLRKILAGFEEKSKKAFHPRSRRDYRNMALHMKLLIKHVIWVEDTNNRLMNQSKTPADL